jgi:hypothetical protein
MLVFPFAAGADQQEASSWLASTCLGPAGTLTVRPGGEAISGYFGNLTALGLADTRRRLDVVQGWMAWYLANAHDSGSGIAGIPDDRRIARDGSLDSIGRPDSTDAYGATFLSLALAAYHAGDPSLRALIKSHQADLVRIGRSAIATQQADGLTWSRPQHRIKYAIDNEQVYRGMLDGAQLFSEAFHDTATAREFRAAAHAVARGLERVLWDPTSQTYRPYVGASGVGPTADLSRAYPDALAQTMAIVYGVVDSRGARAASLLARTATTLNDPSTELEDRAIFVMANHLAGRPLVPVTFIPPAICVDAGWYLILSAQQ